MFNSLKSIPFDFIQDYTECLYLQGYYWTRVTSCTCIEYVKDIGGHVYEKVKSMTFTINDPRTILPIPLVANADDIFRYIVK